MDSTRSGILIREPPRKLMWTPKDTFSFLKNSFVFSLTPDTDTIFYSIGERIEKSSLVSGKPRGHIQAAVEQS